MNEKYAGEKGRERNRVIGLKIIKHRSINHLKQTAGAC